MKKAYKLKQYAGERKGVPFARVKNKKDLPMEDAWVKISHPELILSGAKKTTSSNGVDYYGFKEEGK